MANLIYSLPADNLAATGTPTLATGTANSTYPLTNIYDGRPDTPFKITTTGPLRIVWDWGSARTLGLVALQCHNLTAGLDVRFQMHTANSWGTPDISLQLVIPTAREDGWFHTPWLDLSAQAAKQYASLYVPANAVIPSLGEIWISGTKRSLIENIEFGSTWTEERPAVELLSPVGVRTIHDWGVTRRSISGVISGGISTAGKAALDTWWRSAKGKLLPFVIVPDPDVNEAFLVTHAARFALVEHFVGNWGVEGGFLFEEVSGGVP